MTNILDNLKAEIAKVEVGFQKDEAWVVAELTKAWQLVQTEGRALQVDVEGIFTWIKTHQSQILSVFQAALTGAAEIGTLGVPGAAALVPVATTAIDAATAAVDVLSKAVVAGTTPVSTLVNTYHAVKDASTAVNAVVKAATAKPAPK